MRGFSALQSAASALLSRFMAFYTLRNVTIACTPPLAISFNSLAMITRARNIRAMTKPASPTPPVLKLRLVFHEGAMVGPGKAELLERIRDTGSISAAGRQMKMSYKRAWMLVEEMNAAFQDPLVESTRGGPAGGGARVTDAGERVIIQYRRLEAKVLDAGAPEITALQAMLSAPHTDISQEK